MRVKAYGDKVNIIPVQEKGFKIKNDWNTIKLTSKGIGDPIFKGLTKEFKVFHLNGDTIKRIESIEHLGRSNFCKNQIIKIGDFNYGFQFHFELTERMFNSWLFKAPELVNENLNQLKKDYKQVKNEYIKRGKKIFTNCLRFIKLI